jgi:TPR repeat protein
MYAQGWGVEADAAQAALCFEPAALKNHADAWFNLGVIYASASDGAADAVPAGSREDGHAFARDIPRAVQSFRAAAELGCAQAHHNLGVLFALGQGTPVDVWEAATHYQAAAEAGDPSAQYALGMLLAQENPAIRDAASSKQATFAALEASALLRAAADQGHPGALQQYTLMHADSRDFQPDFRRILDNYRSLADSGDASAQFNLALMYDLGQGTPADQALATHWYAKAAAQNQLAAQYNLGVMGWRTREQDVAALDQARAHWDAAAAAGLAEAQFAAGVLAALDDGEGSALALGYFEQAAEQGHVQAMANLANGLRLAALASDPADPAALGRAAQTYERAGQTYERAAQTYERAALQGDPLAMYMLARAHWHAEGLPHDPVLTVDWYTRAADAGDAGAQFCLGHMYANGQGVAQDYALAARWYLAAAGLPPSPSSPLAQTQEVGLDADVQG